MDWLSQLLNTPPGQMMVLIAVGMVYAFILLLKNEGRRDRAAQDLSLAMKTTNDALLRHFEDSAQRQKDTEAVIRASTRETTHVIEVVGGMENSVSKVTEAVTANTRSMEMFLGTLVTELKAVLEDNKRDRELHRDSSQAMFTFYETLGKQITEAIAGVHSTIEVNEQNILHVLETMTPEQAFKPGFVEYDIVQMMEGRQLRVKAYDPSLLGILGITAEEMRIWSPDGLLTNIYSIKNVPLLKDQIPSYRAMNGYDTSETIKIINSRGEKRYLFVSSTPVRDGDGKIVGVRAYFQDVEPIIGPVLRAAGLNNFPKKRATQEVMQYHPRLEPSPV